LQFIFELPPNNSIEISMTQSVQSVPIYYTNPPKKSSQSQDPACGKPFLKYLGR